MDDKIKKYRINRIFNVLINPKKLIIILLLNLFLVFSLLCDAKGELNGSLIISIAFCDLIIMLILVLQSPKYLTVKNGAVEFDDYAYPSEGISLVVRRPRKTVKVSYTVKDLYDVKYQQSFIERIFDIGHISFKGRARYTAKRDLDRIKEKKVFKIYGITQFSKFKEEFSFCLNRKSTETI